MESSPSRELGEIFKSTSGNSRGADAESVKEFAEVLLQLARVCKRVDNVEAELRDTKEVVKMQKLEIDACKNLMDCTQLQ